MLTSRAGVAKPGAGIFQRALAELDVRADQAVHVGDSLRKDWEGARSIGMRAILLDRTDRYAGNTPTDCDVIRTLEAVLERLGVAGFSELARAHAS